jgi:hypothetical protein
MKTDAGCPDASVCGSFCCGTGEVCTSGDVCCSPASACGGDCCPAGVPCLTLSGGTRSCCTSASIGFVQESYTAPRSGVLNTVVVYLDGGSQTAGDLNVVAVGWNNPSGRVVSVTDSNQNDYQLAASLVQGQGMSQAIYYAANIHSGTNTVTVQLQAPSPGAGTPDVRVVEYSGIDIAAPFDQATGTSGFGVVANSGAVITSSNHELIFGAGMCGWAFGAPGASFTKRVITQDGDIAEDESSASTGSYAATGYVYWADGGPAPWIIQVATFQACH